MKTALKTPFTFLLSLLMILVMTGSGGCEKEETFKDNEPKPIALSSEQKALVESGQGFTFDLLRRVAAEAGDDENVFLSPLSVSLALAMTYNGAAGTTREAMQQAMHLPGLPTGKINEAYQKLMKDLLSVDPKVLLTIANSIWYDVGFQVQIPFVDVNKKYYHAQVNSLDFKDAGAPDIINKWVADNTNNLIQKIIDRIPDDAVMYLINAIYFKGEWKYAFDPDDTSPEPFWLAGGGSVEVDMMHQSEHFNYFSNSLFSAAELPYGRGNYSMVVVLPHSHTGLPAVLEQLDDAFWHELPQKHFTRTELIVGLPKLRFGFEQKLKSGLSDMGMGVAFVPGEADFSGINPDAELFINEVIHKAFVEVNEEGTEAAAVTAVEVGITSVGPPQPIPFRADRPYLFFIRETTTNAVIFAGRVMQPVIE